MSRRRPRVGRDELAERVEVGVRIDDDASAREAAAVDDAGVVQRVGEDDVVRADERGDDADVGVIAGVEEQRGFGSFPAGDARLERAMGREVADDQPGGAGAKAVLAHGAVGGFAQQRASRPSRGSCWTRS